MDINEVELVLDSTAFSHEHHTRSSGLHLSNIIRSIEEDVYKMFKGEGLDPQALEAYRIGGFLFERALYDIILCDTAIQRIGEIDLNGIIMTPDAVNLSNARGIESKCTWRSMRHDVTDQTGEMAAWWMQMMGYAKALNMNRWDLYVFFMNGDYGKNRRPRLRHWEIEFTQDEVDNNWIRILNHAQWMKEAGKI